MTQFDESTTTPPPIATAPVPVQVIGYASEGTINVATGGTRALLGILGGFHFLIGVPGVLWMLAAVTGGFSGGSFDPSQLIWIGITVIVAAIDIACGIWLFVRRPWTWRAIHVTSAVMCGLNLLAAGFFAGVIVYYKNAKGWDGIALFIGIVLFGACSVLFWLHALTKLALLRLNVRRAYHLGDFEPHRLHRVGTFTMMSLYGVMVFVGLVCFIVR
jgi:hypothetical protein